MRYVVGFAAGGGPDVMSRVLCQKMSELTGQQFIVENRGGAGGVIGADAVAKAAPDGYSVGMASIASNALAVGTFAKLPYNPASDFVYISGLWQIPNVLVVNKDLPASSIGDLLLLLKNNPGKFEYGSPGIGTTLHLSGEMMKSLGGVDMRHVPYRGANPALVDLIAGRIPMLFDNLSGSLPQIRDGSVRAIAVTSAVRSEILPNVPSLNEVMPGFDLTSWTALCAAAKQSSEVTAQMNGLAVKSLRDPTIVKKFAELGAMPWPTSVAEITQFRDAEEKRLLPLIRAAGIIPV
ncbi:Bug family tripartite tricarboxylate transporter substrate binding protein [Tardiphaga sp. 215_C5_N2_1]|uniref:Bug family tripartite tricarboxylate transporter substrate binding protein n=1 Tax=Tardiphaga sp. 215_C5_N2_1 TaxID=3240774 RepID=UPI003F89D801